MYHTDSKNPPGFPVRRTLRLKEYDYSQAGAYFLTLCTHDRECLFGQIVDHQMNLNACGDIVRECWQDLSAHYAGMTLDASVIMPNHLHGIMVLTEADVRRKGASQKPGSPGSDQTPLSEIVRGFKTFSARRINEFRRTAGTPVWQRNYYEHIIRDEPDLSRIRGYIADNPARWGKDSYNPLAARNA